MPSVSHVAVRHDIILPMPFGSSGSQKHIKNNSYFAIGIASVEEILNLNILQASLLSMKRAIK